MPLDDLAAEVDARRGGTVARDAVAAARLAGDAPILGRPGYGDLHVGLPMRRAILTELAEARAIRNAHTAGFEEAVDKSQSNRATVLGNQRDGDRRHIASLMRLLHTLRGLA